MWLLNHFIKESREFDEALLECRKQNENLVEKARALAESTTMSTVEALHYVMEEEMKGESMDCSGKR